MGSGFSRSSERTDYQQDRALGNRGEPSRIFNLFKKKSEIIKFREEAITILTKIDESREVKYDEICLQRREILNLMSKIFDSRQSSCQEIFKKIWGHIEHIQDNSHNIKEGLYNLVARDLFHCIVCDASSVGETLKNRMEYNNKEYYSYYLKKIEKCQKMDQSIRSTSSKIEKEFNNYNLYERAKKYLIKENSEKLNDLQCEVMKECYKLHDAVSYLYNEMNSTPFNVFQNEKEKIKDGICLILEYATFDLKETKWYQEHQKNLTNKLRTYRKSFYELKKVDLNNSSEIEKCMENVASLEKKIDEDEQRYGFHPDVVHQFAEYRKMIQHLRVDLGKRFWEDEV
jgi:hypothetical protein